MKKTRSLTNKAGDARRLTRKTIKHFRSAREVDPKLIAAYESGKLRYRGQRGRQKTPTKVQVSIRLSREVLKHFKATGTGWQTRIDRILSAVADAGE